MPDWNVVATVRGSFSEAVGFLRRFGRVRTAGLYNVALLHVDDVRAFLAELHAALAADPRAQHLGHVLPVTERFTFASPDELRARVSAIAMAWSPALAGRAFHTRVHRRGQRGIVRSPELERAVDEAVLAVLEPPGRIDFADPDAVIDIETVREQAGVALWMRDDLARWPLLRHGLGLRDQPGTPATASSAGGEVIR